jgi:predicted nucleic acid-binding Zn ribbon protein
MQCGFISCEQQEANMNNLIWLVGAVVIVLAVLSFFGLR